MKLDPTAWGMGWATLDCARDAWLLLGLEADRPSKRILPIHLPASWEHDAADPRRLGCGGEFSRA
jgi:hypothetical protein